ncbi:hypothetical protein [Rhizobium herbae]|nr:hypothetical protein [Rhizobium herbae]
MTKYNGTLHITEDNAVISNMDITGDIVIDADNVTLNNIKLTSTGAWSAVNVMDGATGFTLQNSEIDGKGLSQNGVYGHGTFVGNDIYGVENGITVSGPSDIRDNYIHNFLGTAEAHYDGIEVNAGHDIDIVHNTVVVDHGQTSAVMLDNYFGGLSNITVENNRLAGGGYTVYLDDTFGGGAVDDGSIKIINNQVGDGQWGDFALYGNNPVMYGNTDLNTLPTDTTSNETVADTTPVIDTPTDTAPTTPTDTAPADNTATDTTVPVDTTETDTTQADTTQADTTQSTSSSGDLGDDGLSLSAQTTADSEADTGATDVAESVATAASSTSDTVDGGDEPIEQTTGSDFVDKDHGTRHDHSSRAGEGDSHRHGGSGDDVHTGALGADDLLGGDTFVFETADASTNGPTGGRDSMFDFSGSHGDRIDLADIGANWAAFADHTFTDLGTAAFTGKAGESHCDKQDSDTYVYGGTNGDRNADLAVHHDDAASLSKDYFLL